MKLGSGFWVLRSGFVLLCALLVMAPGLRAGVRQDRRAITSGPLPTGAYSHAVVAGGLVFVSGVNGLQAGADEMSRAGDITDQTRRALGRLRDTLNASGSSVEQALSVSVAIHSESDFDAMNAVYKEVFAVDPPARTTIVADLLDGALVQFSAIAAPIGAPRQVFLPKGWAKPSRPYSYIVRSGDLVFLSGLLSRKPIDDSFVSGSTDVQVKTILDNAGAALKTVGLSFEDVIAARVFLSSDIYFDDMNNRYRRYFPVEPPARATVMTHLVGLGAVAEITLVASMGEKQVFGPRVWPSIPVSAAVRAGSLVFLSGALDDMAEHKDDIGKQTLETLTRIGRSLGAAGLSWADVVDTTIYLPSLRHASAVNDVYREFFLKDPPARTIIGASLAERSGMIEIMVTAVR